MRTLTRVKVENFLSLKKLDLRLDSLNVLVGPNGAGKTNLLKVFQFLGEVARVELAPAIAAIGGYDQLLYRGDDRNLNSIRIELEGMVTKHASPNALDEYRLNFWRMTNFRLRKVEGRNVEIRPEVFQRVENLVFKRYQGRGRRITLQGGRATVGKTGDREAGPEQTLQIRSGATGLGTLRRLSDEYGSPEWNAFAEVVEDLRLFEIDVEKVRNPSDLNDPSWLRPDASNLASFLLWMSERHPSSFDAIVEDVSFVLPGFERFEFVRQSGGENAVRLDIIEKHLKGSTPLARASFGTVRAIALFAMLHDPNPPRLTCLEEVDHGLHPHALDRIVERLRTASEKTQIVLATHSPALVNRFSESELIIVEREAGSAGSKLARPDPELVKELKENSDYDLGELWFSGVLGGGL